MSALALLAYLEHKYGFGCPACEQSPALPAAPAEVDFAGMALPATK